MTSSPSLLSRDKVLHCFVSFGLVWIIYFCYTIYFSCQAEESANNNSNDDDTVIIDDDEENISDVENNNDGNGDNDNNNNNVPQHNDDDNNDDDDDNNNDHRRTRESSSSSRRTNNNNNDNTFRSCCLNSSFLYSSLSFAREPSYRILSSCILTFLIGIDKEIADAIWDGWPWCFGGKCNADISDIVANMIGILIGGSSLYIILILLPKIFLKLNNGLLTLAENLYT